MMSVEAPLRRLQRNGTLLTDEGMRTEIERQARKLLAKLAEQFDAPVGVDLVETPSLSTAEFHEQEDQPFTTVF